MYYPNLEAELKRKNIRRIDLAKALGLALSTISDKLTGKSDISLALAKKIKDFFRGGYSFRSFVCYRRQ